MSGFEPSEVSVGALKNNKEHKWMAHHNKQQ